MATLDVRLHSPLRHFALDVELTLEAETLALAGPSGAGKTTILRMVAGLARPEAGLVIAGDDVWLDSLRRIDVPPHRRSVGLVPQDYALFPHMTAAANVAFADPGRAPALIDRLGISHLADVRPAELSGGERQRVALARALAREPRVLALDEPLAALDAQTRRRVRHELAELLRALAIPTLLVTHDFHDAAALADRVAIIAGGRVLQLATPAQLVAAPADAFVAAFTGANVLPGVARRAGGGCVIALDGGGELRSATAAEGRVAATVQPWDVTLSRRSSDGLPVRVTSLTPIGPRVRVHAGAVVAEVADNGIAIGDELVASAQPERVTPVRL